ncbi:ATP-binding protein [Streptomyces ferrugineus]|uniref:ATP-binding protein n=1 Tax=Streptomyces ferrugineus TaxID=1413221 RepID=A0A7M2SQ26_9ACTN|nr:ATP-binding protein [Streptomyces ferrugineus]QOV38089.1 ATP-binding protein [Streptomyces ferrugineus]
MNGARCAQRKPWRLPFRAEPEEVASLRRLLRAHLTLWGLHESIEVAQLCVSELVANVINHVGPGTPTTLVVCMNRTYLRIEVHDPDTRALPFLKEGGADSETGRGMGLVDAVTDRWGVDLHADRKVIWCELATPLSSPNGHACGPGFSRAEALLGGCAAVRDRREPGPSRLTMRMTEEAAIDVITDLLHWFRAHGCDADELLDRAQTHFEAKTAAFEGQDRHAV